MFQRLIFTTFSARLRGERQFIQILAGPRQVGKTTLIRQLEKSIDRPFLYVSADDANAPDSTWLNTQWQRARQLCKAQGRMVLAIDEIQKVKDWAQCVKGLWDEDTATEIELQVILSGSSPLLMRKGSSESLAGRFEVLYASHWSFQEMRDCFGYTVDDYLYFGGYPGGAPIRADQDRWQKYIRESLIEATVFQDILALTRIEKPALLKRLFYLSCEYAGQILSFSKIMGQLQDAGNTTTLAHYLDLLTYAGLATGLQKWSPEKVRVRASSPKLLALNSAFLSVTDGSEKAVALADSEYWGHVVENAIGAHLWNSILGTHLELHYWNEVNKEVDFIITGPRSSLAIEVKSGRRKTRVPALYEFCNKNQNVKPLIVGTGGVPIEEFLLSHPKDWLT